MSLAGAGSGKVTDANEGSSVGPPVSATSSPPLFGTGASMRYSSQPRSSASLQPLWTPNSLCSSSLGTGGMPNGHPSMDVRPWPSRETAQGGAATGRKNVLWEPALFSKSSSITQLCDEVTHSTLGGQRGCGNESALGNLAHGGRRRAPQQRRWQAAEAAATVPRHTLNKMLRKNRLWCSIE